VDGFTEFVVPDLVIGGRVYLAAKSGGTSASAARTVGNDF
jgi:hypothetical protein